MQIVIDKANTRGHENHGWLESYHTFSFADYYNPRRMHFGLLRVLNDDIVAPGQGFGTHPHKNMEVISLPLKGELKHGDNIDHTEVITPGDIQVMSAGSGIFHSEFNGSKDKPVEFLQIWVFPRKENTPPSYKSYDVRPVMKKNELGLMIAPDGKAIASINQDAWFSMGSLEKGVEKVYPLHGKDQGVYVFVLDGQVDVDGTLLSKRDGAGIWETGSITLKAMTDSTVLLIEVPMH